MIKASTIYEVLIAMLLFISVATVSFYMLFNVQNSFNAKYDVLKYENIINVYKQQREIANDHAYTVEEREEIYNKSGEFILKTYSVLSDKGEILFVSKELIPYSNE
jgi:Tfp pilus assembly protein PilV